MPGITVIVSPLLSLMEDQVWSLKNLGIEAELLSATTERSQTNAILRMLAENSDACKLPTRSSISHLTHFLAGLQPS